MSGEIKELYKKHRGFIRYGLISVFITLIDVAISRTGELLVNKIISNTAGVLTGFAIQYILVTRYVFNSRNIRTFIIFVVTFIMGLSLANLIVFVCRDYLFSGDDSFFAFLVSKGFSIAIPFFFMYFARKWLIKSDPVEKTVEKK